MELLRMLLDDEPDPDPYLIAAQEVTSADLMRTAYRYGWLSDDRLFRPAVEAR